MDAALGNRNSSLLLKLFDSYAHGPEKNYFRFPELTDNICYRIDIGDIFRLTRTCKSLRYLYRSLKETQWNVDRRLRRFVREPVALRSEMGRHDAVISGSFATQFFDRVLWSSSDLDIFAQQGSSAEAMSNYLQLQEHYKMVRQRTQYPDETHREFCEVSIDTNFSVLMCPRLLTV